MEITRSAEKGERGAWTPGRRAEKHSGDIGTVVSANARVDQRSTQTEGERRSRSAIDTVVGVGDAKNVRVVDGVDSRAVEEVTTIDDERGTSLDRTRDAHSQSGGGTTDDFGGD